MKGGMTREQFPAFVAALHERMPSYTAHLERYPGLKIGWSMDLDAVTLDEALDAVRRMAAGEAEKPPEHERDFLPLYVIQAAKAARNERTRAAQQAEDAVKHDYPERGAWQYVTREEPSMAEMYRQLCAERKRLRAQGCTEREIDEGAHRLANKLFGKPENAP